MKYGLIGKKLGHSFSKEIHEKIAVYSYELKEIVPEEVEKFFIEKDFVAINVTIPYKQTVIPFLDEIDEEAKRIGAVNTVVNRDGKLYGYNTDYFGLKSLIVRLGIPIYGKKVLILGTGGTSKTATTVVEDMGAKEIITVSREKKDNAISYAEAVSMHGDADVIINATPLGMYPKVEETPIEVDKFNKLSGVVDVIYNPLRTKLVLSAQKMGIKAGCGLYMLIAQAVRASEIFTGEKYDDGVVGKVYRDIKKEKENVVLTGMPSSGKSTIGKELTRYGYTFIDTDLEIVKRTGREISKIIKDEGIEEFRKIEKEIIKEVSCVNGAVIATGGGAILDEANVENLKRNGKIYFLDAPIERLKATKDRPLSDDEDKLRALYDERIDRYRQTADVIVNAGTSIEDEIEFIIGSQS